MSKKPSPKPPTPKPPAPKPPKPPKTTPPPFPKLSAKQQKKSRETIRTARSAIAWRQGQLHGKDRWDVVTNPYTSKENYHVIMGRRPVGAKLVKGPRSAYASAQMLDNVPNDLKRRVTINTPGLFSVALSPTGTRKIGLEFHRDIDLGGKADVNITGKGRVFPLPRET